MASVSDIEFHSIEEVATHLSRMSSTSACQTNLSAFCALEISLLDLSCKYWSRSLESVFGTTWHQPPPYSAVIPLLPPDQLRVFLTRVKENEMRDIKIKVGAHIDSGVFEKTLSVLGPQVNLRVDANGAWTQTEALKNIEQMERYGVQAVEQPVAKYNIRGLKEVTANSKIPIIADESVCSLEDARCLVEMGACDAFNVRLSKCGGFFGSMAVLDMARRRSLRCQIGCQVGESGILSAAGRHLAGWSRDLLYFEGSFGTWVLQEDIVKEDIRFGRGGHVSQLTGIGVGVNVRHEALERFCQISETIKF